jgi:hypothetical protein
MPKRPARPENHYARWTDKDRETVRKFWPSVSAKKLHEAFPGRTLRSIQHQASVMGLRKDPEHLKEITREVALKTWQERRGENGREPA